MIPVTAAWLNSRYIDEQMDCRQISMLVQRDPKSVWSWLKKFGIPTRPRGSNQAVLFKPGQRTRLGIPHSAETREKLRQARLKDGHFPKINGRPAWQGVKGQAHPSWRGGASPERQAFYSSSEWRAVRPQVYARANSCCERCSATRAMLRERGSRLHIHHIVSFQVREFRATLSNLVLLCAECHRFVHGPANTERIYLPEAA